MSVDLASVDLVSVDLFLRPGELTLPMDGEALFGRKAPLYLEIGFGNGWFLEQLGTANPGVDVVGAETSVSSVHRAFRRLRRSGLSNVRMFTGDAVFMARHMLAPASVARVFVNFPDPWSRRKHQTKRLLTADFFRLLSGRLAPGGCIELTTDHEEYFEFARREARASEVFDETVATPSAHQLGTRYAKKWALQDKRIHHAVFSCTAHSAHSTLVDDTQPRIQLDAMQHALLTGSLGDIGVMPDVVHRVDDVCVVLMEHLLLPEGGGHVFAFHVEEAGLKQDILIEAIPRDTAIDDGVFVGVRRFASPMATTGVGEALRLVVEWLESRGLTVVDRWY